MSTGTEQASSSNRRCGTRWRRFVCREFCTPDDVCSYVAERKLTHDSLTSSLQVFILDYFMSSSTEDGHFRAGYGQSMFMSQQKDRWLMRDLRTRRGTSFRAD